MSSKLIIFVLVATFLVLYVRTSVPPKTAIVKTPINVLVTPIVTNPQKIPRSHLIKTAFIPQAPLKDWSQPWQDACEEAALLTVDYYYKKISPSPEEIKNSILSMIDFEKKQGWGNDIDIQKMAIVGSDYLNLKPTVVNDPSLEQLKDYISQDQPIIVPADGKILYKENKYFHSGGPYYHNLVLLGFNDFNEKFIVHDVGTQFGAYFQYSYSLLLDAIHDFPGTNRKEDITLGSKNVLVLVK